MKRREFLTNSTLVAAGLTSLMTASCNTDATEKKKAVTAADAKDNSVLAVSSIKFQ
jgi:hypothetical protein